MAAFEVSALGTAENLRFISLTDTAGDETGSGEREGESAVEFTGVIDPAVLGPRLSISVFFPNFSPPIYCPSIK
jgi:hypothetical protein